MNMDILPISKVRQNLPDLVDEVSEFGKRVVISVSGKPKAVVLSFDELESLEETAEILSEPGAYEDIMEGYKEAKKRKGTLLKDLKI